ncbi:response regulator transcription factor [Cupriavidus pauculus]|uniref:response regulator transcription factor n=1 Tax=Cupriavidus pauculus TaxID=82633 RepID=UPI001EE29E21|nr:response regulator transcription factor [Cupriavidus pauculus]GJG98543.1 response regulator transcription factor [Cupriavidus pauculus]
MEVYRVKVVIADDHPAVLEGLQHALIADTIQIVAGARNSTEVIKALDDNAVDVLLTDYAMPGGDFGDGVQLLDFVSRRYPDVQVVVMTMLDNAAVVNNLLAIGVRCILSKSDDMSFLLPAIHIASAKGEYFSPIVTDVIRRFEHGPPALSQRAGLSKRECEVVRLFASGMSVSQIAAHLHRSKQTVSTQKSNAMRRVGVSNDAGLIRYAITTGLVPDAA